jgi:hypothetical protein
MKLRPMRWTCGIGSRPSRRPGSAPRKPSPREYHTSDATREAIARIQSQQPERGILVTPDELAGLFKGQNQYRNGRGNDKESLLTAFDGSGLKGGPGQRGAHQPAAHQSQHYRHDSAGHLAGDDGGFL